MTGNRGGVLKKYLIRFSIVIGVWLLSLPVQSWLNSLEKEYSRPSRFVLPRYIARKVLRKAGYPEKTVIRKVILSGRFSNWSPDSARFQMKKDGGGWFFPLSLLPGRHPYKFVLHVNKPGLYRTEVVWARDPHASHSEPDSFGRRNSVRVVRTTRSVQDFIRFVVLALAFGTAVLSVMEFVIRRLLFFRFSLKYKLVAVFLLFLLLSNVFYLFYMNSQKRKAFLYSQLDLINMLHVAMRHDGIDYNRLDQPAMREKLNLSLNRFFRFIRLRQDYNTRDSGRVQLIRVMVLDRKGSMVAAAFERSAHLFLQDRIGKDAGISRFISHLAAEAFSRRNRQDQMGLVSLNSFDLFTPEMTGKWGRRQIRRERRKMLHFPYNMFLYPIREEAKLQGYYLFEVNAESYSSILGRMLLLNLVYLLVILVLYFFLVKYAGEIILKPINMVVEGINHIRSGDYTYQIWIATNDELDNLGKVYNYTRRKLHYTRKELEHYTEHLESVVEDRARELNRAYKILKEDLFLAKRIQKNLLTGEIRETRGVDMSVVYQPLGEVGGDFYDINEVSRDHIRIFLADATGHGVQAALVTMLIKSEYEKIKDLEDPVEILKRMNREFVHTYRSLTVFFTGVLVDVDLKKKRIRYVSAGHPAQYLIGSGEIERLYERGKMIGVVSEPEYPVQEVPFKEGDRLILFTDGLFEQFNPEGDEMGENTLYAFLQEAVSSGLHKNSVSEITARLIQAGDDFREGSEMNDDITLICAGFRKRKSALPLFKPGKSQIRREE